MKHSFSCLIYYYLSLLLSDYCFEIKTCGIKKKRKKKLSNTNYWLNRGGPAFTQDAFYEDYADGRTERVFHKQNKF